MANRSASIRRPSQHQGMLTLLQTNNVTFDIRTSLALRTLSRFPCIIKCIPTAAGRQQTSVQCGMFLHLAMLFVGKSVTLFLHTLVGCECQKLVKSPCI